jgi:alpha-L-fucosidase
MISAIELSRLALPSTAQAQWQAMELGLFVHFNMKTFAPEWNWRSFTEAPSPERFNPSQLDTDQWMEAAKAMGAKYAVLTTKHCEGFCLWPTQAHEYSVKHSPWREGKGDVVADFVASCHCYDIRPGFYYSVASNGFLKVNDPGLVISGDAEEQARYVAIVRRQLRELWSNYGELYELWFDGSTLPESQGGIDIGPLLDELQPNANVFQSSRATIRWVGNEDGMAPDPCWSTIGSVDEANISGQSAGAGKPNGAVWCPAECDVPMRHNQWFWKAGEEHLVESVEHLMDCYERSVGRNCSLLINASPDTRGLIPEPDFSRYPALGAAIQARYSQPVAQTAGEGDTIKLEWPNLQTIDRIVLREDIRSGHRVRGYVVEAQSGGRWQEICRGTAIGQKKIDCFAPINTSRLRWRCHKAAALPQLPEFSVFATE